MIHEMLRVTDPILEAINDNVGNYCSHRMMAVSPAALLYWLLTSLIITRNMSVNYKASLVAEPCPYRDVAP
jgi:hypothetical protein